MLAKAEADAAITRAGGVRSLGQAEAEVEALKAEARNKLSAALIEYDVNLARIKIIPDALEQAVKPIEKISDIRIFDTGGMLGRGGAGAGSGTGIGLGDGLAAQLLSVSALKPMIDRILVEAGFAPGPDAISALTNALSGQQPQPAANVPAPDSGTPRAAPPKPAKP